VGSVIRERIQEGDDAELNACLSLGPLAKDTGNSPLQWGFLIKIKASGTEQWAYFQPTRAPEHA
jgi:hypothetical protein